MVLSRVCASQLEKAFSRRRLLETVGSKLDPPETRHGYNLTFPVSSVEDAALPCLRLKHQVIRRRTPLLSNQGRSYAISCYNQPRYASPAIYRCQRAATEAMAAAGPLRISSEEAARRGVEVDRILRQREEELAANNFSSKRFPSAETTPPSGRTAEPVAEKRAESGPRRGGSAIIPHLGKLEDRKASGREHVIMLHTFSVARNSMS